MPPSPWIGSTRMQPTLAVGAYGRERLGVVQGREANLGDERLEVRATSRAGP